MMKKSLTMTLHTRKIGDGENNLKVMRSLR